MTIDIYNRNGHPITFTRLSPNHFIMSNGQWLRFGLDNETKWEENKFTFVDPSGGPYISQGMSLGYIHKLWIGKIVSHCSYANKSEELEDATEFNDNDVLIVTYPEQIVQAHVNGKEEFRIYSDNGNVIETLSNFNDAVKWIEDKYDERR